MRDEVVMICDTGGAPEDWVDLIVSIAEDKGVNILCMDFSEVEAQVLALAEADHRPEYGYPLCVRQYDEISDWPPELMYGREPQVTPEDRKQSRADRNIRSVKRTLTMYTRQRRLMPSRSGYRGVRVLKQLNRG